MSPPVTPGKGRSMFKWSTPKFTRSSPRKAKDAPIIVDGEPVVAMEAGELVPYEKLDEEASPDAPPPSSPAPTTPAPPATTEEAGDAAGEGEGEDATELDIEELEAARSFSVLPRVPSDMAAALLAISTGVTSAVVAVIATTAAQLSIVAIGASATLAGLGGAAAASNVAPEPLQDMRTRQGDSTLAEFLPYLCGIGGVDIRTKAMRLRAVTRFAHLAELLLGLLAAVYIYDIALAIEHFIFHWDAIDHKPLLGAQPSVLATVVEGLCAVIFLVAFVQWVASKPLDRVRALCSGEAYQQLEVVAECDGPAPPAVRFEEGRGRLVATQRDAEGEPPKLGMAPSSWLGKIGESFEEAFEDLSDALLRRLGSMPGSSWQPTPPTLTNSRYPLWHEPTALSDGWAEFGIQVRAQPLKAMVALASFSLALDALLVATHSVPPHSLEVSHELFGSFTVKGGGGGGTDPFRLGWSIGALTLGALAAVFSGHRTVRKIVHPAGFADAEHRESDRIEERNAKRSARQIRTHLGWLLTSTYRSRAEGAKLLHKIESAVANAKQFRDDLPFPPEAPRQQSYVTWSEMENGWKLEAPPEESLDDIIPPELTTPLPGPPVPYTPPPPVAPAAAPPPSAAAPAAEGAAAAPGAAQPAAAAPGDALPAAAAPSAAGSEAAAAPAADAGADAVPTTPAAAPSAAPTASAAPAAPAAPAAEPPTPPASPPSPSKRSIPEHSIRPHWVLALDRAVYIAAEYVKPLHVQIVALERIELIAGATYLSPDELIIACEVALSVGVPRSAVHDARLPKPPEWVRAQARAAQEARDLEAGGAEAEPERASLSDIALAPFRAVRDTIVGGVNYVYTSIEDYVNAQIAAAKAKEAREAQKVAADEFLTPALLEVDLAKFRAVVERAKELEVPAEDLLPHEARIKEADACQTALHVMQAMTKEHHILAIKTSELDEKVAAARSAKVPDVLLVTYIDYSRYAKHEQKTNAHLVKLRTLTGVDPLRLNCPEVKASLKAGADGGVPKAALDPFEVLLHAAEAKQAEQTILDVVEAVSDPQTMLSVNSEQLRAMLKTMNRAQAESAFLKLEAKLNEVDGAQAAVNQLEEMGWPPEGVLKVKVAQMRLVIDSALGNNVPAVLLDKYQDRLAEAKEAQELLKRADDLHHAITEGKEEGKSEEELGKLKQQLDAVNMSIEVLKE